MCQEDDKSHLYSDIYYIHRMCSKEPHQSAVTWVFQQLPCHLLINISATSVKILNASMIIFLVSFEPNET